MSIRDRNCRRLLILAAVAMIAVAAKLYYSNAVADDLRWLLAPTAFLVRLVTGDNFIFEPYAGYMNADRSFLIAASCSGINFFVIAFVVAAMVRTLDDGGREYPSWRALSYSLAIAYVATILANTVRISVALETRRDGFKSDLVGSGDLHRIEGVVVYFAALLIVAAIAGSCFRRNKRRHLIAAIGVSLAAYWTLMLIIPLIGGVYRDQTLSTDYVLPLILAPLAISIPVIALIVVRRRTTPRS